MTLSVRLSEEDENLLEIAACNLGKNKSELVRQAVHDFCQKLSFEKTSAYSMGEELFDQGVLSNAPTDPLKQQIWEKLHAKYDYID